ncbi:MAG: Hsp20/alpha crystallin family protein [Bacteroidia bacterium]|nr:Hsp20/alpha crystallin family protein [Bacteroidia bacterium]
MRTHSHSIRERLSDRMFDSGGFSSRSSNLQGTRKPHISTPTVNVGEHKDYYDLEIAVPGYRKEDLTIEVQDSHLTVTGESKVNLLRDETVLIRYEHNLRGFSRTFEFSEQTDPKHIEAHYDSGILSIRLFNKNGKISFAPAKIRVPIQ